MRKYFEVDFAAKLRRIAECGISQKRLAWMIGCHPRSIRDWKDGYKTPHGAFAVAVVRIADMCEECEYTFLEAKDSRHTTANYPGLIRDLMRLFSGAMIARKLGMAPDKISKMAKGKEFAAKSKRKVLALYSAYSPLIDITHGF